jgi:Cu(I)/Ag(I) efflux system outer membrane protein
LDLPSLENFFPEPRLKSLLKLALTENRDLRVAALNVLAARASFGVARGERLPELSLEAVKNVQGGPDLPTTRDYDLGLGLAFETDFFGRLKNMSQAAFQRYLEADEAARAARLTLVGQLAEAYLETRLGQEELALTSRTLANWRAYRAFIEERLISGQSALLDLERARAQVARAEAAEAAAATSLARSEKALDLLTGDLGVKSLPKALALAAWPRPVLPENVSSLVLLRRPDVLAAERALVASHADVGAARAAFFPSLTLTGRYGYMSGQLDELVGGTNAGWSFAPSLTLPLFAGGRNRANLDLSEARRSQAVAQYEKTLLVAFQEVAETLAVRPKLAAELKAQRNYLIVQNRVLELAQNRYQNGAISYLEVLEAQREAYEAEMAILGALRAQILNDVRLYLALGGDLGASLIAANLAGAQ